MLTSFPLREIHEVELSSVCNLACKYCPHPKMERAKAHMSEAVFERTLAHIGHLCEAGTQGEVSLTGIGEAILHPQFVDMMWRVRRLIGSARKLVLATNGVALTRALAQELAAARVHVYVSTHRPEKAGPAFELMKAVGGVVGLNTAFVDSAIDWAGQVKWHRSAKATACEYLRQRWGAVRQDGAVNTCCMDALSLAPIGSVFDDPGSLRTQVTTVCEGCHLLVPAEFLAMAEAG